MKLRRLALLLLAAASASLAACTGRSRTGATPPDVAVHADYLRDLDALAAAVRRLERVVATASDDSASLAALRDAFTTARARYKRVELLTEPITPTTADLINGPVLDEMAEDDPNQFVIPPEGFQVVEEQLHSGQPLAERDALRTEVRVLLANVTRMRHDAAATPFDADAFDARFFAPGASAPATPAMVALGRELFFDPVLSRDERCACASCHRPERGFTDGLPRSLPPAPGIVRRNAPAVVNAALQGATFHDLRTTFLEDQVADVVGNADEMHRSLAEVTAAVHARAEYWGAFRATFGDARDDRERQTQLRQALAAYLCSMQALDSRFDRYVRGDRSALTAPERDGFNVFMEKGKCGTCHFAPLFNGTVPPLYAKTESEVLGVPARPVTARAVVDPDLGRFLVTRLPTHRHAFKTPTLRSVALTAPYMHNGVYRTLEEVVDFYDGGDGAGIGIALPNQTLPTDSLRLTAGEKRALVAFMRALTDTTSVRGRVVVGGASGVR